MVLPITTDRATRPRRCESPGTGCAIGRGRRWRRGRRIVALSAPGIRGQDRGELRRRQSGLAAAAPRFAPCARRAGHFKFIGAWLSEQREARAVLEDMFIKTWQNRHA
ncbi:hypothetical protein [Nannocystis pusilla]|uniref:hypothetical protein n=1 Tax=Nannocystis pusilla TaxID=889268 RepID=UPI003BF1508F